MQNQSRRQDEQDFGSYYTGFIVNTQDDYFFVVDGTSTTFTDQELVRIRPADETVVLDGFNSGDKVTIKVFNIGDLNPRVTDVYAITLEKNGDISNLDESVLSKLEDLGYQVK